MWMVKGPSSPRKNAYLIRTGEEAKGRVDHARRFRELPYCDAFSHSHVTSVHFLHFAPLQSCNAAMLQNHINTSTPSLCLLFVSWIDVWFPPLSQRCRNPDLSKAEIEQMLRDYLGVELVLWLRQGVIGDSDTDGHIDNLAAFARPGEVSLQRQALLVKLWWVIVTR